MATASGGGGHCSSPRLAGQPHLHLEICLDKVISTAGMEAVFTPGVSPPSYPGARANPQGIPGS